MPSISKACRCARLGQGENPFAVKKPKRKQSPRLHALAQRDERIKKKKKQRERS